MANFTPKLYIVKYKVVENAMEKRAPFHEVQSAYYKRLNDSGNLILMGPVGNPPTAALAIFRNLTPEQIDNLVRQDPDVINGVVSKYRIKPFLAVSGEHHLRHDLIKL